jgi:hydroxymethylbilane synthase
VSALERPLRIGTRGSALALWQAHEVARRLETIGEPSEIVVIRTSGDRRSELTPNEALPTDEAGKRLFVKEIEDALLAGSIDLAVHSTKDLPVVLPRELVMAAFLPRATPWDALVLPARHAGVPRTLEAVSAVLGPTPCLGTSSIRRITQLHRLLPGATFEPIRGNVDTRLRKLDEGRYDAIVLACAGLERVGFGDRISLALPVTACVPAPGQGAVGVERRADAPAALVSCLAALDDAATHAEVLAERIVVEILEGGCQAPIGALARASADGTLELHAAVTSLDGDELRAMAFGNTGDPLALGRKVGAQLLADGAADLLARSVVERGDE